MQVDGWSKVSYRSGFKWDVFPFGGRNRLDASVVVTSFYVSEFPDFYKAKNLFELFGCSGNVVEVAISPKRNKFGKRFGFGRFIDVDDGRILAIRLDNIVIDGKKLHVNLPRFARKQGGGKGRLGVSGQVRPTPRNFSFGPLRKESTSYAEVVGKRQDSLPSKVNSALLDFQSDRSVRRRLEKAYVGRVCLPGTAYSLQNYLEMEGIFAIRVTPMGGNCFLLEELEEGFIEDLIKVGETWWKSWFSVVEKWKDDCVDGNRDAWLRVYGVPLHAWCSEFFVSLGECWGRFICLDENTSKGENFDVARLMVNIPISVKIPDSVAVNIDGVSHNLFIREDVQISYRANVNNQKVHSSDEISSESESDRIMADTDSECSIESSGRVDSVCPPSVSTVKKVLVSPCRDFKSNLSAGNKEISKDRLVGPSGDAIASNHYLSADPIVGVILKDSVDEALGHASEFFEGSEANPTKGKAVAVSDDCEAVSLVNRGRNYHRSNRRFGGELELTDGGILLTTAGVAAIPCSPCTDISFGVENVATSDDCDSVPNLRKAGALGVVLGKKSACDGLAVYDVGERRNSGRILNSIATCSTQLEQQQVNGDNLISIAAAVESVPETADFSTSNCNSNMVDQVLLQDKVNMARGRGGGKMLKKSTLNGDTTVTMKNKLAGINKGNFIDGRCYVVSSKGFTPNGPVLSGNTLTCYGDQSEESDIRRNNGRQWEFLKRDVGDRLWKAIIDLGVVDIEGRYSQGGINIKAKIDGDTERKERKEIKKGVQ